MSGVGRGRDARRAPDAGAAGGVRERPLPSSTPRPPADPELRRELLELSRRDLGLRRRLARSGELFDGYNEAMARLHRDNGRRLEAVVDRGGWPGVSRVGEDGAEAAWLVAQHAIGSPALQLRCRQLLAAAVAAGEAPARHLALLTDRIRFNQRRPQLYGTILDWDRHGRLEPWPIEDAGGVDQRRHAAGLPPLAEAVAEARRRARVEGDAPPRSWRARQREIADWARRAGWLDGRADGEQEG